MSKNPGKDTAQGWEEAEEQLAQYLHKNMNDRGRLYYSAIGIGTKAVYYKWDKQRAAGVGSRDEITPMHQGVLDFTEPADRRTIEDFAEQVKLDGWDHSLT